ncbi:MAG: glycosyltransferase family 2 protein [Verrucomicrobia bacterium]|nr:glycosyltransferase family 2 protein [Verrucomicrobiota bacterium]NBY36179.1 glycosyltransferase family 2 protein [Verrucomicrobiota bacterium]
MLATPTLSVVVPTYNCAPLMERHLASMAEWAHLADEIVVVDSRSTDGTLDLIRERLRHPNVRIIERDRGLYESWNEGIAATTGDWIYISTAGDLISEAHLLRLMQEGGRADADVVISPQMFVTEAGEPYLGADYTNADIHGLLAGRGVVTLNPAVVCYYAFRKAKPNALLGSWASNLFRGNFLRARPLPTDYGTHGDTAWTLRHSAEMKLCLVPVAGANFCIHKKETGGPQQTLGRVLDRLFMEEAERLQKKLEMRHAVEQYTLLHLAEDTRAAAMRRRDLWRGTSLCARNRWAWLPATLRYLYLRMRLGLAQSSMERKLCDEIRQLT